MGCDGIKTDDDISEQNGLNSNENNNNQNNGLNNNGKNNQNNNGNEASSRWNDELDLPKTSPPTLILTKK